MYLLFSNEATHQVVENNSERPINGQNNPNFGIEGLKDLGD